MECSVFNQLITDYLDNELNEELKKSFEKHKQGCRKCNKELNELEKSSMLFKKLKVLKFPDGLEEKIEGNLL